MHIIFQINLMLLAHLATFGCKMIWLISKLPIWFGSWVVLLLFLHSGKTHSSLKQKELYKRIEMFLLPWCH